MDNLIVIRLGENLIVFDRDDVPCFYELERTDQRILNDGNELIVYEVPNDEIARQIRNLSGTNLIKEESIIDNNINI